MHGTLLACAGYVENDRSHDVTAWFSPASGCVLSEISHRCIVFFQSELDYSPVSIAGCSLPPFEKKAGVLPRIFGCAKWLRNNRDPFSR